MGSKWGFHPLINEYARVGTRNGKGSFLLLNPFPLVKVPIPEIDPLKKKLLLQKKINL